MHQDATLDVCGKRTLEYVVECLALFNRGHDEITLRGFAGSIPKAIGTARILQDKFGIDIAESQIESIKVANMDSACLHISLKFRPLSAAGVSFDFPDAFVDYSYYSLLLDWHFSKAKLCKISKKDHSSVKDDRGQSHPSGRRTHLLTVMEKGDDLACIRNDALLDEKDGDPKAFSGLSEALYRSGFMLPSNWRDLIRKLSSYDDIILGIDTNVLYGCTVSEHLLPLLSIAFPKKYFATPNWALLVVPSAVMHEIEEAANIRDERGFLQVEGRYGFRAMQEIIELSQGTDIPGVSLIIVGEANPILDTRVEIQGLREDFCKREDKPFDRRSRRSFKKSTGDMIIRDQYKAFLRCIDFHKGTYFITADKSNAALARTEAVNPIFIRRPDASLSDIREIINPKIETDGTDPIRFIVPLGKLAFEMAVSSGQIIIEIGDKTINLGADAKGERLDLWVNRSLLIDQHSRAQLMQGYAGRIDPRVVAHTMRDLQEEFVGLND